MTRIATCAVQLAGWRASSRFERATRAVEERQAHLLREILQRNAGTEYGREHGFAAVRTLRDYARAVPVVGYEDLRERIRRMANGEANVLTAEAPRMFARTSGTTGDPKLIPVTPTCQARANGMRVWLYRALRDHAGILRGRVVSLVSPAVEGHTPAGIPFGSTSGHIYQSMPGVVRRTYLVPYPVFELDDYDAKYYVLLRLALAADVTLLCTANPSTIAKLCEHADQHADALLKDIHDGGLRRDVELPHEVRELVLQQCRPQPETARALGAARKRREGRLLPADAWPRLELIGTWKGGTVGSYLRRFGDWFDPDGRAPVPVRDLGWLSSEARCTVPCTDEGFDGILDVGSHVYEFVEADQVEEHPDDPGHWEFLGAHEVDAPRDYYAFLTTTGGLYRYDINDIVRVTGFHREAPLVAFQRKGRGMTSITGEKLAEGQVIEAVTGAADEVGLQIPHFRAMADVGAARYVFQVESANGLSKPQGRKLLEAIERRLTELNLEYAAKRKSHRLEPPELHVMKHGWYDQGKQSQGRRLFQSKTIVLKPQEEDEELSIRSQEMRAARIGMDDAGTSS